MFEDSDRQNGFPLYDVVVVGAGPAGAEAALAAGCAGARTLCLTINLDTVGFPPATPVLVDDEHDVRGAMLAEMEQSGAALPRLIASTRVAPQRPPDFQGRLAVDRRRLGLSYKEALESASGVELRQALVTNVAGSGMQALQAEGNQTAGPGTAWRVRTNLEECFQAAAVVLAGGTFLNGVLEDSGERRPGGRRGEIPSRALASCLQEMGVSLVTVTATTNPRLDRTGLSRPDRRTPAVMPRDGDQFGEFLVPGLWPQGGRLVQLEQVRSFTGFPSAWITRSSYTVHHQVLAAGQVRESLESVSHPGLFFTGRLAGSCNYVEAAILGWQAGTNASRFAAGGADFLTNNNELVVKLCQAIANREDRPVTIRIPGPGC